LTVTDEEENRCLICQKRTGKEMVDLLKAQETIKRPQLASR
jgi:hypothetical protein